MTYAIPLQAFAASTLRTSTISIGRLVLTEIARQRLLNLYDGSGVDHLWLAGQYVDWETGQPGESPDGRDTSTHCSAFVAAMTKRVRVYILRPPEAPLQLLANKQADWLAHPSNGWTRLAGEEAAQAAADGGRMVVASYKNPDRHKAGHIALVRPRAHAGGALPAGGPEITQAGTKNYRKCSLQTGFGSLRRAATTFYAHGI